VRKKRNTIGMNILHKIRYDEGECWIWTGAKTVAGYGVVRRGKSNTVVHRIFYEMYNDRIPPGHYLKHTCKNRLCVNPGHLYVTNK
jgi:hypothetical protein